MRKLDDNPGIIPVKLGTAKIKDYAYTLIHYYDLNPIILEINKLHHKSQNISTTIGTHKEYNADISNYIELLKLTQDRVENKIKEIIPHPERIKRGLVNGLGSIFKAVTGNLDASDGERYEKLIYELRQNQNNLQANILKQNSLSLSVIDKFNSTIQQINYNEKLLESKINQISLIVQKAAYRENSLYMKDIINQILNVYEIINSILQDVENSLTFSKLKIMHPSIIKTEDLFIELTKLQKRTGFSQMPLPVTLENTLLYEKLINIESFVLNNKITYLLHIPIMHPNPFDYFHMYSVPIYYQSLFKVVLPRNKYLLKNQLHYAYYNQECQEILPESYICEKENLNEIEENSPCEVKLLNSDKDTSSCKQTEVKITQPIINRLDKTNQWILVLPAKEAIKFKCFGQTEVQNARGTYLCHIPIGCQIITNSESIINDQKLIKANNQPILFPDFADTPTLLPVLNLSLHLHDLKLDGLHRLKNEVIQNQPHLVFSEISKTPSLWTVLLYILIAIFCLFLAYKKMMPKVIRRIQRKCPKEEMIEIQLPRQAL